MIKWKTDVWDIAYEGKVQVNFKGVREKGFQQLLGHSLEFLPERIDFILRMWIFICLLTTL